MPMELTETAPLLSLSVGPFDASLTEQFLAMAPCLVSDKSIESRVIVRGSVHSSGGNCIKSPPV